MLTADCESEFLVKLFENDLISSPLDIMSLALRGSMRRWFIISRSPPPSRRAIICRLLSSSDNRRRDFPSLIGCLEPTQPSAAAMRVEDLSQPFIEAGVEASPGRPPMALLVHGFLSSSECTSVISRVADNFEPSCMLYPPSYRNNELFDTFDAPFAEKLYSRMLPLLPVVLAWPNRHAATSILKDVELATWRPHSLNPLWRFSRYSVGQLFRPHLDGHYIPEAELESKVSITLYLNDGFEGGETVFYSDKTLAREIVRVRPVAGTLALFDHDLWHDGSRVNSGVPKVILRSDVVFQVQDAKPLTKGRSTQLAKRSDHGAARVLMAPQGQALDYSSPTKESPYSLLHHCNYVFRLLLLSRGGLLSASRDTTIAEWSMQGKVKHVYHGHIRSVLCLAELDSGNLFVSGGRDFSLRLWKQGEPDPVAVQQDAHYGNVLCLTPVSTSLGSNHFLSGGADGMVRCWRVGQNRIELIEEHNMHSSWVYSIAMDLSDPSAGIMYTASEDGTVKRWRNFALEHACHLDSPIYVVALLGDGTVVVGDDDGRITVLDEELKIQRSLQAHGRSVRAIVQVQPGMIATASEDGTIKLVDTRLAELPITTLSFHRNFVRSLCLLPNGRLASGSYDGRIKLWDFEQISRREQQ